MIGEMSSSHTGVSGPPTRTMPQLYTTRFLGFDLEPAEGKYRINHIYRDGPADKEWLDLKVGDYVLAIDVRNNTGGNIDEQLLDIIERRPYMFTNSRSGARTWGRRPRQAIAGPKVMMINQRSFSDGEATPMGFRTLGLGRIVGTPTAGGVIWTGSYSLINGGSVRTPSQLAVTYDPTKPNNYGINLENYGVPPDVWGQSTTTSPFS
jgi:hypothetical protein